MKKKTLKNILGVSFIILSLVITQIPMAPVSAEEGGLPPEPYFGPVINESGVLTAYYLTEGQTEVTLPDTVVSIASGAFSGCEGIVKIVLPESVNNIQSNAFAGLANLTNITMNGNEIAIADNAFKGCVSLCGIYVSSGVGSFKDNMFIDNNNRLILYTGNASEITLPKNVLSIAGGAFSNLFSVKSIKVSDRLSLIAADAFGDLDNFSFIATAQTEGAATVYDFVYNSGKNIVIDYSSNSTTGKGSSIEIKSGVTGMNEQTVTVSSKGLANGSYYFVITTSHGNVILPLIQADPNLKDIDTSNMFFMDLSLKTTAYQNVSDFEQLTITLPIPEAFSSADKREYVDVYTVSADGTYLEKISDELVIKSDIPYIRFTTSHFSEYALINTKEKKPVNNPSPAPVVPDNNNVAPAQNPQAAPASADPAVPIGSDNGGNNGASHVKDNTPKTGDATTYKTIFSCTFFMVGLLLLLLGNKNKQKSIAEI